MIEATLRFLEQMENGSVEWIRRPIMARYTSFHIGGVAELLIYPATAEALCTIVDYLRQIEMKHVVLGRMTNLLFTDEDYCGAVVCTSHIKGITQDGPAVIAECGVTLAELCRYLRDASLTGHEFAYGIPGSVGGAVFMNAGAGGKEMSDILRTVTYYDAKEGKVHTIPADACGFAYRSSVFQSSPDRLILRAEFMLAPGDKAAIQADMDARMAKRAATQPLEYPNAGSTFKRNGQCIVSKLIDETGLKGLRVGDAEVSCKHAGFIVNRGNATARDVRQLIRQIKEIILEKHGITLSEEILFIE